MRSRGVVTRTSFPARVAGSRLQSMCTHGLSGRERRAVARSMAGCDMKARVAARVASMTREGSFHPGRPTSLGVLTRRCPRFFEEQRARGAGFRRSGAVTRRTASEDAFRAARLRDDSPGQRSRAFRARGARARWCLRSKSVLSLPVAGLVRAAGVSSRRVGRWASLGLSGWLSSVRVVISSHALQTRH